MMYEQFTSRLGPHNAIEIAIVFTVFPHKNPVPASSRGTMTNENDMRKE